MFHKEKKLSTTIQK